MKMVLDNGMDLSDLDGFLTGLVIGPELIMPDESMPVIWGEEETEFKSEAQIDAAFRMIVGRDNDIASGFNFDSERFEPILWK